MPLEPQSRTAPSGDPTGATQEVLGAPTIATNQRRARVCVAVGCLALLAAIAFCAFARIHVTLRDRNFDARSADGMLRSDPALLYYFTERIIESGGLPPDDFRADPRVHHPELTDIPARFTVGQEFLVAWCWLLFGGGVPLHVFCVIVMSLVASLCAVGVFGLARELTKSWVWAGLAALLFASLLYNYRTLGAILIREDLSLPAFALHLWLMARAARLRTTWSWIGAGLALTLSLATWHAMSFVVLMEVLVLLAWFLRTAESPFDLPRAWIVLAVAAAAGLAVPVLWGTRLLISPAILILTALLSVSILDRRRSWSAWRRRGAALLALAAGVLAARSLGGQTDYSHVASLMLGKIRHLGVIPQDPAALDFDARLLWQGPFMTASLGEIVSGLGVGCAIALATLALAAPGWWRGRGDRSFLLLALFVAAAAVSGWLVARTLVLLGILLPALGAVLLSRLPGRWIGPVLMCAAIGGQVTYLFRFAQQRRGQYIGWYAETLPDGRPVGPERNRELARLVRWARENLPSEAPIASDYVTSTALLAHNRNPIVCQPKYEFAESRRRIEEFARAYLRGTPAEFHRFARSYGCSYAVINRLDNWWLLGYPAGYSFQEVNFGPPPEGTAAAAFGGIDARELSSIPGFRLVYRELAQTRMDFYRVYALE